MLGLERVLVILSTVHLSCLTDCSLALTDTDFPGGSNGKASAYNAKIGCTKIAGCIYNEISVYIIMKLYILLCGFPWWLSGKESCSAGNVYRRHGFDPWVGEFP